MTIDNSRLRQTRVLLLVENNSYPGDFRIRREALALRSAGSTVSVVAPRGPDQTWYEEIDGVHVYRFPAGLGGSGLLSYAFEFGYSTFAMLLLAIWISIRRGFDVSHAANPPDTLWLIGLFFKPFGKKFIFDQHDLAPEVYLSRFGKQRGGLVYRTLLFLERCSYKVADVVISTNESYRRVAMTRGEKRPDQVFVVRNGPPLSYRSVDPDPVLAARATHLIGYVGTIGPQDGVDCLLRAIQSMVYDLGRRDFLAVVIGDGDALPELRRLAVELRIEPYLEFTGRLEEAQVRRRLSAVHVCVQPDPSSPLNDKSTMNKLMEYMALGKPTVAFNLPETRVSGCDAVVYVDSDEAAFAKEIIRLFDDPEERDRMGRIGRERIDTTLAWEYSVPPLLEAYSRGLGLHMDVAARSAKTAGMPS
jgi:glycosyltransferase involved in cell wall biosynthesis